MESCKGDILMKRKTISVLLVLMLVFCGTTVAFADIDFSVWDSRGPYPADILGTRHFESVSFLIDRRIITGDEDGLFHPNRSVTRAEFAIMMARATNHTAEIQAMAHEQIFNDLMGFTWARPYINAAATAGLFQGRGNGRFAPGETVTYAEVMTVLIRMNRGSADAAENMAATWPENYIMFAETYNLVGGRVFIDDWNAPAPRGDVAILLHRMLPGS